MDTSILARTIGRRIRDGRTAQGMTQRQLAAAAGVSERLVRSIEQGEARAVGLDNLNRVLSVLGLELTLSEESAQPQVGVHAEEYSDILKQAVSEWMYGERND